MTMHRNLRHLPMLAVLLCARLAAAADGLPLTAPDYEQFTPAAAARMSEAARTNLSPVYPALAEYLVERFQLAHRAGVGVDVGGGPGSLTLELSRRTPRFYWINTDINTFHATAFFARALTLDCAGRVGMIFADAHHLPFRSDYADFVVSRGSIPFWAEPKKALAEIYRVLKPGGQAFIGRGFSPNLPLDVARRVRENQGGGVPRYDVAETMEAWRRLMLELGIKDFEIIRPREDQREVNYGVWLRFSKPSTQAP
jgi:SAM-dependent methyltransferase